ncbi:MAG: PRD domain-containing protein [Eubacterium sp.]
MYCVKKVLNNNAVLAVDLRRKEEVIFMGKGVGFNKKINEPFDDPEGVKKYHLQKQTSKGPSEKLINAVDPVYLEIANDIIRLSEDKFKNVDNNVLLPLADHIAFSIVRMDSQMDLSNPFTEDIRLLFEEEYTIAQKGKEIISTRTGRTIPEDEVGYITLYIHSALTDTQVSESMQIPMIIRQSIKRIENECGIAIDMGSFAYNRLLYHIKCMLARVHNNERLNNDMIEFTKEKCAYSFEVARDICTKLEEKLGEHFTEKEISYLALHIERIRTTE